jgi:phage terminase small subunit
MPPIGEFGPKMRALSESHRAFVLAYIAIRGRSATEAAIMAGYAPGDGAKVSAHRIGHRKDVQEAMLEEMVKQNRLDLVSYYANVRDIAMTSSKEEVKLKANLEMMSMGGMSAVTRHEVVVEERRTTKDIVDELRRLAAETGNLGKAIAGDVIEGEFEEVEDDDLFGDGW